MVDINPVGQRFGRWVVIGPAPKGKYGHAQWQCRCDCGNVRAVIQSKLITGWSKSCGCIRPNFLDLTGQRFGRLTVLERGVSNTDRQSRWLCSCDCGGTALVVSHNLRTGHTISCGCAHLDALTTHGKTRSSEYTAWISMRRRCYSPKDISYPRYGALGVRVCERWRDSFENFYADMGEKPGPEYSLDRISSAGDYSPDNCRWATIQTQDNNRRSNRLLTFHGRTQTAMQWARELGLSAATIYSRLANGWAVEQVLSRPSRRAPKQ